MMANQYVVSQSKRAQTPTSRGLLALGITCLCATLLHTMPSMLSVFVRWSTVDSLIRESIVYPSVVASIFMALKTRIFSQHSVIVGWVSVRKRTDIFRDIVGKVCAVTALAYTLGILPIIIRHALYASWSHIDILSCVSAYVMLLGMVVIAACLSAWIPSLWAVGIVPVIVMLIEELPAVINFWLLTNTGHSMLTIAPVWLEELPGLGYGVSVRALLMRMAYVLCVVCACVVWARHSLDRDEPREFIDVTAIVASLSALSLAVTSVIVPAQLFVPRSVKLECESSSEHVTLCIHPADTPLRQRIDSALQRVRALTPHDKNLVVLEGITPTSLLEIDGKVVNAQEVGTLQHVHNLDLTGKEDEKELLQKVYDFVIHDISVPLHNCPIVQGQPSDSFNLMSGLSGAIQMRLGVSVKTTAIDESTGNAVLPQEALRMKDMNDDEFREWYVSHRDTIYSCDIVAADFAR